MAGNELYIAKYLFNNIGAVSLRRLGKVTEVGAPDNSAKKYKKITTLTEINLIATQGAEKKADIYVNGKGISLKQTGGSFPFNRLQRADILTVFKQLGISNPEEKLMRIDQEVDNYHKGAVQTRRFHWTKLFNEHDFKTLVRYLMTEGSPKLGRSSHPADYIAEAPKSGISSQNIHVYTFDEYFAKYKSSIYFAIRRQWIGQSSNTEHNRAVGISKKVGNKKWIYNEVEGSPRANKKGEKWRSEISKSDRKTCYMIFVEKK